MYLQSAVSFSMTVVCSRFSRIYETLIFRVRNLWYQFPCHMVCSNCPLCLSLIFLKFCCLISFLTIYHFLIWVGALARIYRNRLPGLWSTTEKTLLLPFVMKQILTFPSKPSSHLFVRSPLIMTLFVCIFVFSGSEVFIARDT